MDVIGAIGRIRTVREFEDRPVSDEDLARILEAGRRAGSSKNLQRWDFVVVRDRERLRALSGAGAWAGHVAGAAVAVALVTPDPGVADAPLSIVFDLGRAAQNMVLVAWELGIGSCPATVYEQELVRRTLGYPAESHCEYILSFGYPADPTALTRPNRTGRRKPLDTIVHDEGW